VTERGSARRRWAGRTAIAFGIGCALGAGALVVYAGYELWGTGGEERAVQAELREAFDAAGVAAAEPGAAASAPTTTEASPDVDEADPPSTPVVDLLPGGADPTAARLQFPDDGPALARLSIPAIEVDKFVMRDVDVASLQVGPGAFGAVRPGFDGNAAIAGHRTTYGAPFGRVDELRPGDEISVYSADGRFTYVVLDPADAFGDRIDDVKEVAAGHVVVDPADTWVVSDFGDSRLTLASCHPEFRSTNRIVVVAELVSEPVPWGDFFAGRSEAQLRQLGAAETVSAAS
jgi:sortase A